MSEIFLKGFSQKDFPMHDLHSLNGNTSIVPVRDFNTYNKLLDLKTFDIVHNGQSMSVTISEHALAQTFVYQPDTTMLSFGVFCLPH